MNILIFGKDGQLGKAFKAIFESKKRKDQGRIYYIGRRECDLANSDAIEGLLNQIRPSLIINAAAYTSVDQAETEIYLAFAINAKAPEMMALYALENNATLLHYSTDYVFDGYKDGFYTEDDLRNPLGIYGKSKAAGEQMIERVFANLPERSKAQYAILRTSWLYGDGCNFIRTILRIAKEREELKIISDQYGAPTSAQWLACVSLDLVFSKEGQLKRFPCGTYHAVPSGQATWHRLASLAVESAISAGVVLKARLNTIKPILGVEYKSLAPRPMNSLMATNKLRRVLAIQGLINSKPATTQKNGSISYTEFALAPSFPAWDDMVCEYVKKLAEEKAI
jgi:dTDP-4-dehydrorhamnose reductase